MIDTKNEMVSNSYKLAYGFETWFIITKIFEKSSFSFKSGKNDNFLCNYVNYIM